MTKDNCCKTKNNRYPPYLWVIIALIGMMILAVILVFGLFVNTATLGGVQAQQDNAGQTVIEDGENIVFNSLLNNQSPDIAYDTSTGEFTITKPGNYYVSWWVTTDGSSSSTNMNFSIAVNGTPHSIGTSPIVTGQVSGSELITVESSPTIITLINNSSDEILMANTPVQSNIVIIELIP